MNNTSHSNHTTHLQPVAEKHKMVTVELFGDTTTNLVGSTLSNEEILGDLTKLLRYLKINLAEQQQGVSSFLKTPLQALLYAERMATYAMHDYPRYVEGEPRVTPLWDALYEIRQTVFLGRTGEQDEETELSTIEEIVQNALRA